MMMCRWEFKRHGTLCCSQMLKRIFFISASIFLDFYDFGLGVVQKFSFLESLKKSSYASIGGLDEKKSRQLSKTRQTHPNELN